MMHQLIQNQFAIAMAFCCLVLIVVSVARRAGGGFSWSLTRTGRLAQWSHARKIVQAEERARKAFKSHGTVTHVRNHAEKGDIFAGMAGFTELETTEGVLIVDDLVGAISNGLAVYVNQDGQVRIGGLYSRTFALRREKGPASTVA
jgi:hypothetical protein